MTQEKVIQSVIRQHLSYFQKGFFKNKFIDNTRSMINIYRRHRYMNPAEMPAVFVGYEIEDNPQNTLTQSNFPYESPGHWIGGPLSTFYQRIYFNPHNKISIFANYVRKRVTFNIRYTFQDRYLQEDVYNFMINTFPYGGPGMKWDNMYSIMAPIPSNMLEYLAVMQSYNLRDPSFLKRFTRELEEYSTGMIHRYKVLMVDKQDMFFMGYKDRLMKLLQPDRPEKDSGETVGQMRTKFGITEQLVFEPHIPTFFVTNVPEIVNGKKTPDKYHPMTFGAFDIDPRLFKTRDMCIDPLPRNYKQTMDPEVVVTTENFTVSSNGQEEVISLNDLLSDTHLSVINSIKKRLTGDPGAGYVVRLWAYGTELTLGVDYTVNWDTMDITILNTIQNAAYKLTISRNVPMTNAFIANLATEAKTSKFDTGNTIVSDIPSGTREIILSGVENIIIGSYISFEGDANIYKVIDVNTETNTITLSIPLLKPITSNAAIYYHGVQQEEEKKTASSVYINGHTMKNGDIPRGT
jgi:hypothetical protein